MRPCCCLFLVAAAVAAHGYEIPAGSTVHYTDIASSLDASTVVNVGEGAAFDLDKSSVTLKAVTGAGVVSNGTLTLTLAGGPYAYAGRFIGGTGMNLKFSRTEGATDDEFGFVIGDSLTLKNCVYTEPACAGSVLRFAAGLGRAEIGDYIAVGGGQVVKTDDVGGSPVTVAATWHDDNLTTFSLYKLVAEGSGDIFTIKLVNGAAQGYAYVTGDSFKNLRGRFGTEAGYLWVAAPIDLSNLSSFHLNGAVSQKSAYALFAASSTPYVLGCVTGKGTLDARGNVTIEECYVTSSTILSAGSGSMTINGGAFSSVSGTQTVGPNASGATFTINGGLMGSPFGTWNRSGGSLIRRPGDANFYAGGGRLDINGGDVYFKQTMPNLTYVNGGAIHLMGVLTGGSNASPRYFHFDGGSFWIDCNTQNGGGGSIKWTSTQADAVIFKVGAKGMSYGADMIASMYSAWDVNHLIQSDVDEGTDGGILFSSGLGSFKFTRPITVTGPVTLKDGTQTIGQTAEGSVFGSGDLCLKGAGTLAYDSSLAAGTIALANGSGAKMSVAGVWKLIVRQSSGNEQNWTIGPTDASASSLVRSRSGTVLYVCDWTSGATYAGTVKVAGGLATYANGRVKDPIFWTSTDAVASRHYHNFARYDATDGIVPFTAYDEGVAGGATSVAKVSTAKVTLAEDAAVAALRVDGISGINPGASQDATASLVIPSGFRLTVGNGTDPACVLLNNYASNARAAIKGAGTLDFGTSEGVIAANGGTGYAAGAIVNAKISGSGGVTFAAICDETPFIYLGSANDYSGGTRIASAMVIVGNSKAFGTGDVYLEDSINAGGRIYILSDGVNITNTLHIAGRGPSQTYTRWGAIVLSDDLSGKINTAEISGDVELIGRPRVMAHRNGNGSTLTFSGTLSGNDFEAWGGEYNNGVSPYHANKKIVFTKPNVYTGLTQVIRENLWLKERGTTGLGGVELDDGHLVIDTTRPVTIRGKLSGVGTVELRNKRTVTFAKFPGDTYSTLTLDVVGDGKRREVNSLKGFKNIVNSTGVETKLYVRDKSRPSGTVDSSVTIVDGSSLGFAVLVR